MNKLLLSFAVLSLLAACDAGAPPAGSKAPAGPAPTGAAPTGAAPADAGGHFIIQAPGSQVLEVLIDNGNITGPNIMVTRYRTDTDHALRGTVLGKTVDVTITDHKATGIYGAGPMDIATEHRDGKVHISGLVSGSMTDFELNMKILKGRIGQCAYDLTWNGKAYEGTRGCGTSAARVTVYVPSTLGKWSEPEMAACLGVLMSEPSNDASASTGGRLEGASIPGISSGSKKPPAGRIDQ
jgi:hypothetical protein